MSNIWFISCLAVFLCSNPVWSEDEKFPSELVRFKLTQNRPDIRGGLPNEMGRHHPRARLESWAKAISEDVVYWL